MGKGKGKVKKQCCGKFKKSGKHCSKCPLLVRDKCMTLTEARDQGKKAKKKAKKKKNKHK
jgi:hypothetical protein